MDREESTARVESAYEMAMATRDSKLETSVLLQSLRACNPASSIAIILPDFLSSVNLKYVKLGYHYLITHAMVLMVIPVLIITVAESWFRIGWTDILQLWDNLHFNLVSCSCKKREFIQLAANSYNIHCHVGCNSRPKPGWMEEMDCCSSISCP